MVTGISDEFLYSFEHFTLHVPLDFKALQYVLFCTKHLFWHLLRATIAIHSHVTNWIKRLKTTLSSTTADCASSDHYHATFYHKQTVTLIDNRYWTP